MKRHILSAFYRETEYWPRKRRALRPRELHFPLEVWEQLKNSTDRELIELLDDDKIVVPVSSEVCKSWAPIFAHESLFHYYKAFYNYLAARSLYFGGMLHWIDITVYYAKFYLARSLAALVGKQSYMVRPNHRFHLPAIASVLGRGKNRGIAAYRVRLDVDMVTQTAVVTCDRERVSSHRDVWHDYGSLGVEDLDVFNLLYRLSGEGTDYLTEERNEENYSMDGYMQLDFNLDPSKFIDYFERDFVKADANRLYDLLSGDVLLAFSHQYGLFNSLGIKDLPIELDKFEHMINYCLPGSHAKDKLLMLCKDGFPTQDLWSVDGSDFYDERNRIL